LNVVGKEFWIQFIGILDSFFIKLLSMEDMRNNRGKKER
jgi:hypothetical protein